MDKEEYNRLFGRFIQQKRDAQKHWTQADLAARMGNNFQNISRLERGEINPTLFWFNTLAAAFDMKSSELLQEFEAYMEKQNGKGAAGASGFAHYNKLSS